MKEQLGTATEEIPDYNPFDLADFNEYREAIETLVRSYAIEPPGTTFTDNIPDELLTYKEELWAMQNNFTFAQWEDVEHVARNRFYREQAEKRQLA